MNGLPQLPPGFVLDDEPAASGAMPPLPPGFELEPDQQTFGGAAMNATAGANEVLYGTLGAPVDLVRGGMNLATRGINAVAGTDIPQIPEDSFGGSRSIANAMGAVRPELDPANTKAETSNDRIARGVGQGVAGAVVPAGVVGGAQRAGVAVSPLVQAMAGRSGSAGAVAADAFAGGAAGAGAATAQEFTGDQMDPLSGLAGGIVGGGLGAVATGIPALTRAVAEASGNYLAPLRQSGRERLAGERLVQGATDPKAVLRKLDDPQAPLVPGSNPTTFQATGDMGLGALEREAQTRSPAEFMQRRADQNNARRGALDAIQPTGAPEQVSRLLREQVDAIDADTARAMDDARTWEDGARRALGPGQAPEEAGNAMRGKLQAARDAAKAREDQLWQAVDPDGTLALPAENARKFVRDFLPSVPASARRPGGEEAAIYDVLRQYGDVSSFREVQALQSRVKTEMRRERMEAGETPAYGRLAQLNSALFRDLESAALGKVEQQQQAVARGEMRAEDTVEAFLVREQQRYAADQQQATGVVGSAGIAEPAGGAAQAVSGAGRAEGAAGRRSGSPSSDPRLSGDGLAANFDDAALGRLNEARDATSARAGTFDNATLKPALRRPATNAPYQMRDASVARNLFTPGAGSFEKIQTYRQAVGNDPDALGALEGFAVDSLRKAAIDRDTGAINPAKLEGWRRAHADALRAFPELDIKIGTAGDAARAVEQAAKARKATLDETQRGAFGKLVGAEDPETVRNLVGGLFSRQDTAEQMAAIRRRVGGDKPAAEGFRKAVADHIMTRLVSNTEAATTGRELLKADQFQTFVKTNRNALRAVFSEPEVKVLEAVAADLQRSNRSNASVKIPNQSNTAQDQRSILQNVIDEGGKNWTAIAGGAAGAAVGGAAGAAAGTGLPLLFNAMRMNGINAVDELVRDALLHPERARFLMAKVPADRKQADFMFDALARRYVKAATVGAAVDPKEDRPKTGPVSLPPWMTQAEPSSALQRALADR